VTNAYDRLDSADGARLLAALAPFSEAHVPAAAALARRMADRELAAAALSTVFARRRALASRKFSRAAEMFFTRAGYEQSSSEAIARHTAERFTSFRRVADLCCGIGSDSISIAGVRPPGGTVSGVDLDTDALVCARHNALVYGVKPSAAFSIGDALRWPLEDMDAAFADPSRRTASGRAKTGADYSPPLRGILARIGDLREAALGVKIAPGLRVTEDALRDECGAPVELEYISERGVCKEAIAWCGALARRHGARRATVIAADGVHPLDGDPASTPEVRPLQAWLGEPDAAVIRSGLVGVACESIGAALLDPNVAYVTAPRAPATPFVRWYEVLAAMPFNEKKLRALLRARDIGLLVIKTRAFPLLPEAIEALLKARGEASAVLVCTTIGEKKMAILCRPMERSSSLERLVPAVD
jgi:SAM-dependent methyltransferase